MQVGMWLGYVSFGFIADRTGRKRAYVVYLLVAAVLVPIYATVREPALLLALGPFVAFFGTGYFSGFGAVTYAIYRDPHFLGFVLIGLLAIAGAARRLTRA